MNRSSKILRYVGKRLLQGIPIILAIVVMNFFLLNLAEGDAVDVLAKNLGLISHYLCSWPFILKTLSHWIWGIRFGTTCP